MDRLITIRMGDAEQPTVDPGQRYRQSVFTHG